MNERQYIVQDVVILNILYKIYMIFMLFRLTNAPAVFQHMMNDFFLEYLDHFVVIYLNDILIYSKNEKKHEHHVYLVLEKITRTRTLCQAREIIFPSIDGRIFGLYCLG